MRISFHLALACVEHIAAQHPDFGEQYYALTSGEKLSIIYDWMADRSRQGALTPRAIETIKLQLSSANVTPRA